ncbi:MAG TPA: hypothetical protein VHN18_14630 [Micromonosporaceae bacterium]|nr:hypothetical protein [Micromonosporaceae bacterium]
MAIPLAGALWSWSVDGLASADKIHSALSGVLGRPVVPLASADPDELPSGAVLCDVWHPGGEFPTSIECYAPPAEAVETVVAAAVARRLGRSLLLPDDTLDPSRFLLAAPDATLRPVHVDVADTDEGQALSRLRPCTGRSRPADGPDRCRQSRWAPGSVVPVRAAA